MSDQPENSRRPRPPGSEERGVITDAAAVTSVVANLATAYQVYRGNHSKPKDK
jgi:hypothetical protein